MLLVLLAVIPALWFLLSTTPGTGS